MEQNRDGRSCGVEYHQVDTQDTEIWKPPLYLNSQSVYLMVVNEWSMSSEMQSVNTDNTKSYRVLLDVRALTWILLSASVSLLEKSCGWSKAAVTKLRGQDVRFTWKTF